MYTNGTPAQAAEPNPLRTMGLDIALRLAGDVTVLAALRRRVASALADMDPEDLDAVLLVCTELVTNAFDHAHAPQRFTVTRQPAAGTRSARRRCAGWLVSIAAEDTSPESPTAGMSRLGASRGHGLILVTELARDWGTDIGHNDHGKTIWATMLCRPAAGRYCTDLPDWADPDDGPTELAC
jgi:two-component sensor histidine kinase